MNELPLSGIRVVDLTRLLPGAYCSSLLLGLGAEVTVIDDPSGRDPMLEIERRMGGDGGFARALRAGKQCRALDLAAGDGRRELARLVDAADVLLDSPRPGIAGERRHGVAAHRGLVHCSLTAGGIEGPLASRRGHDLGLLAMSGVLDLLRGDDGTPAVPGVQIAGVGAAAMPAVQAILAALLARARDGRGCRLVVSTLHHLPSWTGLERSVTAPRDVAERGTEPGGASRPSALRGRLPCYNVYRTADRRHLTVAAVQPRLWASFCTAVERPAWIARQDDPALVAEVRELVAARPLAAWLELAGRHDLCVEPVADVHAATAAIEAAGVGAPGVAWLPGVWSSEHAEDR